MSQKWPQIGLRAVFDITGFTKPYRRYQTMMRDVTKSTQQTAQAVSRAGSGMARSWEQFVDSSKELEAVLKKPIDTAAYTEIKDAFFELGRGARVNVGLFDELTERGISYADAMRVAGGQTRFNIEMFDQLTQQGVEVGEAFRRSTSYVNLLGRSFSTTAIAVTAATAALRVGIRIVRESNEAYDELAEATRRVRYQTGLLTKEASTWVTVMEVSGISTAQAERALTSFLGKVADLRRDMLEGEELTSDFAKAISTLGVSVVDSEGNLRSTADILNDVNRAFRELGPGIVSAQLATDLFGYSGRQMLPILVDQERSLADLADEIERYGANLGALDTEKNEELRASTIRLSEAVLGFKVQIGRGWVEARTNWNNFLTDLLDGLRKMDAGIRAGRAVWESLERGELDVFRNRNFLIEQYQYFLTGETEVARAAEESAQARADTAQDAAAKIAASEKKIREERDKTLQQLDNLKAQYAQKLADIEREAAQRWSDILVERQRDATDRALQVAWRLDDLWAAYRARMASIEADFAKRWDDILVKRQRDAIERGMRLAWRYEDMARELAKRRQDIEEDASRKREDLERDHQRKLRDIQQRFLDTAEEAARRNDAVAVARAQRERNRAIRDEMQRYTDEREDFERSLQKKRDDIERDRRERERDLQRELKRERILRELHYRWELEDFEKAKQEQKDAAEEWRKNQLAAMQKAHDREVILLQIQHRRQLEDFNRTKRRQFEDAHRWYIRERDELAAHLDITGQQLEMAYRLWTNAAAAAAKRAAIEIATAWAAGAGWRAGQDILMGPPPTIGMAEGGVIQASSPTTVLMGEAGTETGIFLPGRASSMNVNHNFGQLGVDFGGLPGGMNTQQIQALVYATMVQLAKGIQIPRT